MISSRSKIFALLSMATKTASQTMTGTGSESNNNNEEGLNTLALIIFIPFASGLLGYAVAKCWLNTRNRRHTAAANAQQTPAIISVPEVNHQGSVSAVPIQDETMISLVSLENNSMLADKDKVSTASPKSNDSVKFHY
jgi:hypothetical protein